MLGKPKPIKDLFFRYLKGTKYEGRITPHELALELHDAGLIGLLPGDMIGGITHYRELSSYSDVMVQQNLINLSQPRL